MASLEGGNLYIDSKNNLDAYFFVDCLRAKYQKELLKGKCL